jgi:adenylate kinase
MAKGGNIVEYHSCDFFPERWFQVVYVVRCNNTILYERLEKRGYSNTKLQANVQCEIFQTVLDEALDSYVPNIVFELKSETDDDLEKNLKILDEWLEKWKKANNPDSD